jgi:hypothetical protein
MDEQATRMAHEVLLAETKLAFYDLTDEERAEARALFPTYRRATPVVRVGTGPLPTMLLWSRPATSH